MDSVKKEHCLPFPPSAYLQPHTETRHKTTLLSNSELSVTAQKISADPKAQPLPAWSLARSLGLYLLEQDPPHILPFDPPIFSGKFNSTHLITVSATMTLAVGRDFDCLVFFPNTHCKQQEGSSPPPPLK